MNSCHVPTSTAQNDNVLEWSPAKQIEDVQAEEPLDPILLDALQQRQQTVKPFAWCGPQEAGIIIGMNAKS